jgi:hypothetical protein
MDAEAVKAFRDSIAKHIAATCWHVASEEPANTGEYLTRDTRGCISAAVWDGSKWLTNRTVVGWMEIPQ